MEREGRRGVEQSWEGHHAGQELSGNATAEDDDPEEAPVRRAMGSPQFSIFEVTESHSFIGVVVRDLVRGSTFVVDATVRSRGW